VQRSSTQQTYIAAPVEGVWALVGDPNRHPEWWPDWADASCPDPSEGCRYRGVTVGMFGRAEERDLLLERLEGFHEISIFCKGTGVTTTFELTEGQGGTFVEGRFSVEPNSTGMKLLGAVAGRRVMRSWLSRSLEARKQAAEREPASVP
jgi:uncharacterized protein YndB with AHSA1/START domain